jgi:hypothetical protein
MRFLKLNRVNFVLGWIIASFSLVSHGQVTINEIIADNRTIANLDGSISDWVELYNPGAQPVSLQNWSLSDIGSNPRRWVFPNNITLPANGYLVVALDPNRPPSAAAGGLLNAGFGVKAMGDSLLLYSPSGVLIDSLRFGPQAVDFSIGALPSGSDQFVLTSPTPGGANIAQELGSPTVLRINEWMADPASGEDWFEVYSSAALPVQLTGLYFADSNLEPSPVAPLSFIGTGRAGFVRFYADNSTNDNEVDFGLGTGGDSIGVYNSAGILIDRVVFGAQTEDRSQGRLPDGSSNIQPLTLATPAESNLVLYEGVWVNEILTHTDAPFEDAVEFYNNRNAPVNIGGWYLSDSRSDLQKYRIPDGTTIPAGGYLVIYENQFKGPTTANPFTFSSAQGDRVILSEVGTGGALTGYVVEEQFEAAERGVPFGRHPISIPNMALFVPLERPTFGVDEPASVEQFRTGAGAPNASPKIGPIVISEIMYNPGLNPATVDSPSDPEEYIELTNISSSPVALYDPANPDNVWKITRGVTFGFPRFSSIPASASVLVVSFDPSVELSLLAAFRTKYAVPQNIAIFGPFAGKLDNAGEAVSLYRPDTPQQPPHPDAGFVPFILVDRVDYTDDPPWPIEPDGSGQSLQRKTLAAFGNDPANWLAGPPTAGQPPGGAELKIDSITHAGGIASLTFATTPGGTYAVEFRSEMAPGAPWGVLLTTNATGSAVTFSELSTATRRFYRVLVPGGN